MFRLEQLRGFGFATAVVVSGDADLERTIGAAGVAALLDATVGSELARMRVTVRGRRETVVYHLVDTLSALL
jgi:hypothetical protein